MKKNCKIVVRDGKGNGRALKSDAVTDALKCYLDGRNPEARYFALGLCRDSDEADELVQEACYRALKARKRHDATKAVKSWLFTILRNVFMDSRRRKERRDGVSLDYCCGADDSAPLHETLPGIDEDMLGRLERAETSAQVRRAMARLRATEREVLTLCDARGMAYGEAARTLGVPENTLRSRLHRARLKLRKTAGRVGLI
ncbi:MAG: RNA polymerase sigma factor [Elusimicrobia bacterium]|nr:RNA polymerase sigma factor [Elusimicrobiota bacterium]